MNEVDKVLLNAQQLQEIAQQLLAKAKSLGATQADVSVSANKGFQVSAHEGDVEAVQYHQDKGISIEVYFGKRRGSASTTDIRPAAINDVVEAACHIAKFTDEDGYAGLPEKAELAFNYPSIDIAAPWPISVEEAIQRACESEKLAMEQDKRIVCAEESTVATSLGLHLYANSEGFIGHYPFSRHEMSCVLIAKEKEEMQRDYSYTIATHPQLLKSTKEIAHEAAQKVLSRLGARRLRTQTAPVIFIAERAEGLLGHFTSAMSGGNIYRKSSFLVDHLDKTIFPDFIQIQEFPHLPQALSSAPFDAEGVYTRENRFIVDGVLASYALGSYSARKLGMKTTGNAGGVHNLVINHSEHNLAGLLKMMGKGLLVTELMGHGINMLTGDYSRGAAGFWVENGEIQYPVHEVTIAGRLQDMFAGIAAVGNDVDIRGGIRTGSILINQMMIAGE